MNWKHYYCEKCKYKHKKGSFIYKTHLRYGRIPKDIDGLTLGIGDFVQIKKGVLKGSIGKIVDVPSKTSVIILYLYNNHPKKIRISSEAIALKHPTEGIKEEIEKVKK